MGAKAPTGERRTDHDHQPPAWIVRVIVGLAAGLVLTVAGVVTVGIYAYQSYEFVQGRGAYRDAEAARLDERINRVVCDVLNEIPAGDERADRLRARYGCPSPHPLEEEP